MKRWIIFLIPLILCGCSKNVSLDIPTNTITNIVYEDTEIRNSDFDKIISEINDKKFYDLQNIDVEGKKLTIDTNDELYNLEVFDNYLVYTIDNKRYYTKVDNISMYINDIVDKYDNPIIKANKNN
nr:hypothetical protein [Bacilli bacterium]